MPRNHCTRIFLNLLPALIYSVFVSTPALGQTEPVIQKECRHHVIDYNDTIFLGLASENENCLSKFVLQMDQHHEALTGIAFLGDHPEHCRILVNHVVIDQCSPADGTCPHID